MLNYFKRKKIKRAIDYHTIMRDSLIHAKGSWYFYCETHESDLTSRSAAENRCINRLMKLMEKYK